MANTLRYRNLVAWQRADDLVVDVCLLTKQRLPAEERFGLTAQMRRAAASVAANIVEGTARSHAKERVQFLRTSWASLVELGYLLHISHRLEFLDDATHEDFERRVRQTSSPLLGLIRHTDRTQAH
jgi:four helix bundle protein